MCVRVLLVCDGSLDVTGPQRQLSPFRGRLLGFVFRVTPLREALVLVLVVVGGGGLSFPLTVFTQEG